MLFPQATRPILHTICYSLISLLEYVLPEGIAASRAASMLS
ncbi:hypothetical protein APHMUC_1475 [Anaplasma phagocytophilum str. ApMUC09]|uniref:Uncharacterized protein n=1 Tax=Anaplasma phagocytophilum str. ApMUC09 TaxID=1359152 RepID=A0A0F3N8R5_ANAPH|nr:hypothetical protein APHMUC_1475 [Anaplasma phagocytophilum str. ApMUC09]